VEIQAFVVLGVMLAAVVGLVWLVVHLWRKDGPVEDAPSYPWWRYALAIGVVVGVSFLIRGTAALFAP